MKQALRQQAQKISNMLSRGVVTLATAAGKMQTLQISLLDDEAKDGVEHFEPYGFTSNPKVGAEVLAAFIEGDRSHGIVICAADRRFRLAGLKSGEVALYDDLNHVIKLSRTGIEITGGGHEIKITNCPKVTVTGGDVVADGISLKNHKHGGVQAGSAQTGVPA